MLRDAGVRTKLLAVLALPTVLLILTTSLLVGGQLSEARRAQQVQQMTEVATHVNEVVHALQLERSATLTYLQDPSPDNVDLLSEQRGRTDVAMGTLRTSIEASPLAEMPASMLRAAAQSAQAHGELRSARASIDDGRFFTTEADVFYTKVIASDLPLPALLTEVAEPEVAQQLLAFNALSRAIEYAAHERDLVQVALIAGSLNEVGFAQSTALVAQHREALRDFGRTADAASFNRLDGALAEADNVEIDQVRRRLSDLLQGRDPDPGASRAWVDSAGTRLSAMTTAERKLVADIGDSSSAIELSQERRALALVGIAVLGLGLALVLAIGLARRITRPLGRLTAAAGEIGHELPLMVTRMQTPGEGPGVVVEPIPVESADEIGRLAEAFNTVNTVTVRVAKEQAALRSSIAEMFVNVARRNQVLLGRQLKALDTMEAKEENPDVLQQLFTIDHLATRMRRNAESLLVLAGIDSTRRLRSRLSLSDVVRTAIGEIEAFDRIDLSMTEDPDVSGRHALTVAHLLAELLENATHFSNPETRVVVSVAVTPAGVDVVVTDHGLGMTPQELAEANQNIAEPPVAEIAVSQRLGLFVVGRLSARLGATVTLRAGRSAGTVATASLPAAIFEGLAVTEPAAFAPEPAGPSSPELAVPSAPEPASPSAPEPASPFAPPLPAAPAFFAPQPGAPASGLPPLAVRRPTATSDASDAAPVAPPLAAPAPTASAPTAAPVAAPAPPAPAPTAAPVAAPAPPAPAPTAAPLEAFAAATAPVTAPAAPVAPVADLAPPALPEVRPVAPDRPADVAAPFGPSVDVLPSRAPSGRLGRHRSPVPAPETAAAPTPEPVPAPAPEPGPRGADAAAAVPAPARPAADGRPAVPLQAGPVKNGPAATAPVPSPSAPVGLARPTPPAPRGNPAPQATPAAPLTASAPPASAPPASAPPASAPPASATPASAPPASAPAAAAPDPRVYEPAFAPVGSPAEASADAGLSRRTPRAAPAPAPTPLVAAAPGRARNPSDVRGMLSGFRAGVERGRFVPEAIDAIDAADAGDAADAPDAPVDPSLAPAGRRSLSDHAPATDDQRDSQ